MRRGEKNFQQSAVSVQLLDKRVQHPLHLGGRLSHFLLVAAGRLTHELLQATNDTPNHLRACGSRTQAGAFMIAGASAPLDQIRRDVPRRALQPAGE
jgi:hypothetical protein